MGSALAASAVAASAATSRSVAEGGAAGTDAKRRRCFTAFAQRRKVTQPVIASKPSAFAGLTRRLTASAVACTSPQSAKANPIAAALYCRRGSNC